MFQKKIIISGLIIFCSLMLVGCNGINSNDDFENKKKCASIIAEREKDYFLDTPHYIIEIIYSKKHNSCLAYYNNVESSTKVLNDVLSRKEICYVNNNMKSYIDTKEYTKAQKEFAECIEKNR